MSVAETLLRVLVRFPKLLVVIAKRCSSVVLHLLRYLFSSWNASARKWERKHLLEGNADNNSSSRLPSVSGEKDGEADASAESAAALCSEDEGSAFGRKLTPPEGPTPAGMPSTGGGFSNSSTLQSSVRSSAVLLGCNTPIYPPAQPPECPLQLCRSPLEKGLFTRNSLYGPIYMLMFLDHPGFVERSLKDTQCHTESRRKTDIRKWKAFWETFQKDVENIILLATVLLSGNVSFLAIITQNGLLYWPQRLSYVSLVAALRSILMGLAVRTPRFFTAHMPFYFRVMVLVLGFPFELFLYSIILFIAALIVHFIINAAMLQIYAAVVIMGLVIVCLSLYWLVTEPLERKHLPSEEPPEEGMARRG